MREQRPVPENPATFGERLYNLRMQRGLTQSEVARPRYTKAYISMLEGAKTAPTLRVVEHVAKRLGVTAIELLGIDLAALSTRALLQELERRVTPHGR